MGISLENWQTCNCISIYNFSEHFSHDYEKKYNEPLITVVI
jgi:hypothetical protein